MLWSFDAFAVLAFNNQKTMWIVDAQTFIGYNLIDSEVYLFAYREVFLDFDPIDVSKLNEKRIAMQGSPASSLLSELKLRSIIENARQICKVETWTFSICFFPPWCKPDIDFLFFVIFLK